MAGLDEGEVLGFDDRLRAAVAQLNTEQHAGQLVGDVADPAGELFAMSEDVFEDARLAVVAQGRTVWAAVVEDPTKMSGTWPLPVGEELLDAVRGAYEETNRKPWPDLTLGGPVKSELPPVRRWRWLYVIAPQDDEGRRRWLPPGYRDHLMYLEEVVNQDEVWWQWWDQARGGESTLEYMIEVRRSGRPGVSFRETKDFAGRDQVICAARIVWPEEPADAAATVSGPQLARQHFELLMARLGRRYGLIPPVDLPDTTVLEQRRRRWVADRNAAEHREQVAMDAWNRKRSSEHIWRGRAPDSAVDELIRETRQGGRIVRLPTMIASLRKRYQIPIDPTDAERLTEAGYNPSEIQLILGTTDPNSDER